MKQPIDPAVLYAAINDLAERLEALESALSPRPPMFPPVIGQTEITSEWGVGRHGEWGEPHRPGLAQTDELR